MAKKEKKQKEPKRKPKYGMFSCVKYIYQLIWKNERSLVFVGIFTVPISLIMSVFSLYTPSIMLKTLETYNRFSRISLVILGLLTAKFLFDLTNTILSPKFGVAESYVMANMSYMFEKRHRDRDWHLDLDPMVQKMDERAENAMQSNHSAGVHFPMDFSNMLSQILNFILFGSVISLLHPAIIVLLAAGTALNFFIGKWGREENWKERDVRNTIDKKISYSISQIARDLKYAKDIRLYTMQKPLHNRLLQLFDLRQNEQKKLEYRSILMSIGHALILLVRDGVSYAFLIYKTVNGDVDASSFVLYFSAIASMAGLMNGILGTFNRVYDGAMQISDYREAMEIPDKLNRGNGIPVPQGPFSIEFKNVSYKYPQGEKKVLNNVSFKIEAGEKIALVGLNGAGKTTLTLIMCGFLLPDEGEVLVDGHPLTAYNRDEMYGLFGFVPQDYHFLPVSIAKNIACALTNEEIDYEKLNYCLEKVGLVEKISSLPLGIETPLFREANLDGIDLSGGEKQKLLLARLLYKNPPCIILDEPTAALDPIAEDRMYRQYNTIATHATSIFISHRLASTRFCDRIFLLDGANCAEVGTHDELMKLRGKYRELYDIQSKYYREDSAKGEKNCDA